LTLPSASREELKRLLLLQIENEFPLPPNELAWGYQMLGEKDSSQNPGIRTQEVLVVAVRKELIEEYAEFLSAAGFNPVFTLAALARGRLAPSTSGSYAVLDTGRCQSEFATFENGVLVSVRVLPWGDESIARAIEKNLDCSLDEAEKLKQQLDQGIALEPALEARVRSTVEAAYDALWRLLNGAGHASKVYLSGADAHQADLAQVLARRLGNGGQCERLDANTGEGGSAAILGLKKAVEEDAAGLPLALEVKPMNGAAGRARPAPLKWAVLTAVLVLAALSFPYAEATILKERLSHRLSALQADKGRLVIIDRELGFLQYLKQNQPPYLDAMFMLSKFAPPGTRIDSLSMNRRGELSWRGSLKDGNQVADFRSKLMDSGFFAAVAVEEQTPTPDRQKVSVRITAQWKSAADRESLSLGLTAAELAKPKAAGLERMSGAPPPKTNVVSSPVRTPPARPDSPE
jgi:hypothetical protein